MLYHEYLFQRGKHSTVFRKSQMVGTVYCTHRENLATELILLRKVCEHFGGLGANVGKVLSPFGENFLRFFNGFGVLGIARGNELSQCHANGGGANGIEVAQVVGGVLYRDSGRLGNSLLCFGFRLVVGHKLLCAGNAFCLVQKRVNNRSFAACADQQALQSAHASTCTATAASTTSTKRQDHGAGR